MLRLRRDHAGSGGTHCSARLGSHDDDSPTTGPTSSSPPPTTEETQPTTSSTKHTTEPTTTLDAGTTESPTKSSNSHSSSNAVPSSTDSVSSTQRPGGAVAAADQTVPGGTLTTLTTSGVETFTTTSLINGTPIVITSQRSFTRTSTALVTGVTAGSTSSKNNNTGMITGSVVGGAVTGIILLGLTIFFVLRHKRRHKASRSTSVPGVSVSPNVLVQCMSQSTPLPTTPRPFLDFPVMQNCSPTKGTITDCAKTLPVQNSGGNIEPANPFRDPVITEGNLSDNGGEGQRVRNALDDLRALTSRFERELQQLGALAQSGQLSAEDRLKLEEIRRTTGLTIQFDPRRDRFSIVKSPSSASSPSFAPPSYHTRSD